MKIEFYKLNLVYHFPYDDDWFHLYSIIDLSPHIRNLKEDPIHLHRYAELGWLRKEDNPKLRFRTTFTH